MIYREALRHVRATDWTDDQRLELAFHEVCLMLAVAVEENLLPPEAIGNGRPMADRLREGVERALASPR